MSTKTYHYIKILLVSSFLLIMALIFISFNSMYNFDYQMLMFSIVTLLVYAYNKIKRVSYRTQLVFIKYIILYSCLCTKYSMATYTEEYFEHIDSCYHTGISTIRPKRCIDIVNHWKTSMHTH